jgi:hypothetical protein
MESPSDFFMNQIFRLIRIDHFPRIDIPQPKTDNHRGLAGWKVS